MRGSPEVRQRSQLLPLFRFESFPNTQVVNVNEELCPYSDLDEHKNKTHGGLSVTCAIQCSRGEMIKKTIHEGM